MFVRAGLGRLSGRLRAAELLQVGNARMLLAAWKLFPELQQPSVKTIQRLDSAQDWFKMMMLLFKRKFPEGIRLSSPMGLEMH